METSVITTSSDSQILFCSNLYRISSANSGTKNSGSKHFSDNFAFSVIGGTSAVHVMLFNHRLLGGARTGDLKFSSGEDSVRGGSGHICGHWVRVSRWRSKGRRVHKLLFENRDLLERGKIDVEDIAWLSILGNVACTRHQGVSKSKAGLVRARCWALGHAVGKGAHFSLGEIGLQNTGHQRGSLVFHGRITTRITTRSIHYRRLSCTRSIHYRRLSWNHYRLWGLEVLVKKLGILRLGCWSRRWAAVFVVVVLVTRLAVELTKVAGFFGERTSQEKSEDRGLNEHGFGVGLLRNVLLTNCER